MPLVTESLLESLLQYYCEFSTIFLEVLFLKLSKIGIYYYFTFFIVASPNRFLSIDTNVPVLLFGNNFQFFQKIFDKLYSLASLGFHYESIYVVEGLYSEGHIFSERPIFHSKLSWESRLILLQF